jgi:hypothetical protein
MKLRHLSALIVVAFVWTTTPAHAQTALRFKYAKGQVNNYEMLQEMKFSQNIGGANIDMEMKQTIETSQTIDDVLADGSAKATTKFTRVKIDIKGPFAVTLDSADLKAADGNPIATMMAGVVKALAKVEFSATHKPNGEMADVKVAEGVVKGFKNLPGAALMGDMFTEDGLKQMMSQSGMTVPKDAVAEGATWSQKVSNKLPSGKMTGEMKYTYRGKETVDGKTFQKITYTPDLAIDPDPKAVPIKLKSQKGTGTILFDNDLGRIHELVMETTTEMSMAIANINQDQTVVQKMTMKVRK